MEAMPDLERRDMIVLAGTTPEGQDWVGSMGNYMGTFVAPFLGIPATGHLAHMRYHEFFQVTDGRITEMQMIWDIPELMMQANAWPLAPQLGAYRRGHCAASLAVARTGPNGRRRLAHGCRASCGLLGREGGPGPSPPPGGWPPPHLGEP